MLKASLAVLLLSVAASSVSAFFFNRLQARESISDEGTHLLICKQEPIELGIVLDSSSSISRKDFEKAKTFLQNFLEQFDIGDGDEGVRVSIIPYGKGIYPEEGFDLDSYEDSKEELLEAVRNIDHKAGLYTDTGKAIAYMHNHQMSPDKVRPIAERVSIVITDGNSQLWRLTKEEAQKARDDGITIFAVGVGSGIRDEELENIAGDNSRVMKVDNYDKLDEIKDHLARETCIKKEKPTTTPPPRSACGEVNPSDIYFVFSPASLGLDATQWTTSFISQTISTEEMDEGFRYGVISGSCPDDEGFDLDAYDNVDDIKTRMLDYDRPKEAQLLDRLLNDGYTEERGARPDAGRVAVLVASAGRNRDLSEKVEALVADGVQVFIADPTGSGVEIAGAKTLSGRSSKEQSAELVSSLCPQ